MRPAHVVCSLLLLTGLVLAVDSTRASDIRLMLADTEMVFVFNVKQLLDSELAKSQHQLIRLIREGMAKKLAGESDRIKDLQKWGIDLKDVDRFVFVHPGTKDKDDGVLVFEGKFDSDRFVAAFKELATASPKEVRSLKAGGTTIHEFIGKPRSTYVALHENKMLLAGLVKERLTDVLEQLAGSRKPELKREFKDLLDAVSEKHTFSMVATAPALFNLVESLKIPRALLDPQRNFTGSSLAITVARDIEFEFILGVPDKATADKMVEGSRTALIFVRGMFAVQARKDPKVAPLVELVDSLRVKAVGTRVVVRGEMPYATVEKLILDALKNGKK